jgi:hypothetical protein
MKFANVKSLAAKLSIATVAAGALLIAGTAQAQAQQWGVAVQYGQPAYVATRNDYYRDRNRNEFYERERARQEILERERREEFLRRQAYIHHEQWEHQRGYSDHDGGRASFGYR